MKALFLILFLGVPVFTQDNAQPDRWRGLILDKTISEEAIASLGKPTSDKPGKLLAFQIQNWLTKDAKKKIFRVLEFKKPEGIDKARLYFLNDKLVAIELDLTKGVSPSGLSNIYGIPFEPLVSSVDVAFNPRAYERNQGKVYPSTYPTVYAMVAVSESSFVSAMISNVPSFGGALARSMGIPDQPGSLPGKVEFVTLISRTLENRDGVNVLK